VEQSNQIITDNIKPDAPVFFQGINALRFFAALAVIITHVELLKGAFGFKHQWKHPVIFNLGGLGVYFFFVLSGFLITYLLLKEKGEVGKVKIRNFYIRRVLRIWPLYYLILFLGFFILPYIPGMNIGYLQQAFVQNYTANLVLFMFILPNAAFAFFSPVPHIGHLWSIGVEEQFYICWPFVIGKTQNILKWLITIVICLILIKIYVVFLGKYYSSSALYQSIRMLVAMSKFECMAIGGIGAYILYNMKEPYLKIIYNKHVFNLSLLMIPGLIYFTPNYLQDGVHLVYSFIFLIIILNSITPKKLRLNLEKKTLSYLGKISYGLYMYHFMIVALVMYIFKDILIVSEFYFNLLVYPSVIGLSILISSISYELFEKRFIRMKARFSIIKSTDSKS